MVDESRLCEILGYRTPDPNIIGTKAAETIATAVAAVDRARISGRLKRFSAKNPKTGDVAAYGYRRADVRRILGMD